MLGLASPLQSYVDAVFARMQALAGFTSEDQCAGVLWGRAQGAITLDAGLVRMESAAEHDFPAGMKMGQLQVCRDLVDDAVTARMIALLAPHPMLAALVYISGLRDEAVHGHALTEAERRALLAHFHSAYQGDGRSRLPRAEAEIAAAAAAGETYPILLPEG